MKQQNYRDILQAPSAYWLLSPKEKKEICNGVGPKGLGWLFPDTYWGLRMSAAANIHDYEYNKGKTLADKAIADANFKENCFAIIRANPTWDWLTELRRKRVVHVDMILRNSKLSIAAFKKKS